YRPYHIAMLLGSSGKLLTGNSLHFKLGSFREQDIYSLIGSLYLPDQSSYLDYILFIIYLHYVKTKVGFHHPNGTCRVFKGKIVERGNHHTFLEITKITSSGRRGTIRIVPCQLG